MATSAPGAAAAPSPEELLYGLIEVAERQQDAAHGLLQALSAEREAFAGDRQAWVSAAGDLKVEVQAAVLDAVAGGVAEAGQVSAAAVQEATEELVEAISSMSGQAGEAESALRTIAAWASWRLLSWIMGAMAGLLLLWWLANCLLFWSDTSAIASAQQRKAQLLSDVAQLKANRDTWLKAGMIGRIERCGSARRACVRVDESAGAFGDRGDLRIIRGD